MNFVLNGKKKTFFQEINSFILESSETYSAIFSTFGWKVKTGFKNANQYLTRTTGIQGEQSEIVRMGAG